MNVSGVLGPECHSLPLCFPTYRQWEITTAVCNVPGIQNIPQSGIRLIIFTLSQKLLRVQQHRAIYFIISQSFTSPAASSYVVPFYT